MRTTLLMTAVLLLALPAAAKPAWVKKAQEAGFADVKDCKACHAALPVKKDGVFTDRGKFLVDMKAHKKAAEVDLAWLKDYKGR